MRNIKKQELQSIIKCVESEDYTYNQYSYGAFGAGFITNYMITITDAEHSNKYGRSVYWVRFSARGYGRVLTYGSTYNRSWYDKYAYYDNLVFEIVRDGKKLSRYLH